MLNTRNHTLIRNATRNEGRVVAQYLVRVGGGVAILAAAVFAVGSLQFGALHEALVRMGPPSGLQVGTGQFGDMPMNSIEAGLAAAASIGETGHARVDIATTPVVEVYDDITGDLLARMPDAIQAGASQANAPERLARK